MEKRIIEQSTGQVNPLSIVLELSGSSHQSKKPKSSCDGGPGFQRNVLCIAAPNIGVRLSYGRLIRRPIGCQHIAEHETDFMESIFAKEPQ